MTCKLCVTDYDTPNQYDECNCIETAYYSNGGESKIAELKLSDFGSSGDATNLSRVDGKALTITEVVRQDYEENKGVRITTKESFDVDGASYNKFYTTRTYLVEKFLNDNQTPTPLNMAINQGGEIKLKVVQKTSKKGKEYYVFEQA